MASELYRTYEVLIEETVHPSHTKRGRTGKDSRYNADTHAALRTTNELFQDAVCYYTIMLAGMCRDADRNPLWEAWMNQPKLRSQLDSVVGKLSKDYPGAVFNGAADLEAFLAKAYSYRGAGGDGNLLPLRQSPPSPESLTQTLFGHIKPMFVSTDEESGAEKCGDLMPAANTVRGWLCNPSGNTNLAGMGVYDCLHREFLELMKSDPDGVEWVKSHEASKRGTKESKAKAKAESAARSGLVFKKRDILKQVRDRVRGVVDQRAGQLRERAVQKARDANAGNALGPAAVAELLKEGWTTTKKGPYDGLFSNLPGASYLTGIAQRETKAITDAAETERFVRIQELGATGVKRDDHKFSRPLYRLCWLMDSSDADWQAAVKDILEYVVANKPEAASGSMMPYQTVPQEPLFPHFTNCLGIPLKAGDQAAWGAFDQAALATAAEDVFKFKIRTDERAGRVRKLRMLKKDVEEEAGTKVLEKEYSPLGRKITVRGLVNDARWKGEKDDAKGIIFLLDDLIKGSPWEETGYRLRMGTIGGWSGLRQRFLKLAVWASRRPATRVKRLPALLDLAVTAEQTDNRQGFGSADFFRLLAKPEYHHLWNEAGAAASAALQNGIKDFLHYFTLYSEWMLELTDLFARDEFDRVIGDPGDESIRPISYTFPGKLNRHGKTSQRHLRYAAAIGTRMSLSLFTRKGGTFAVAEAPLTVSARRLKRDRILTPNGDSIAALWCPPLMTDGGANLLREDKAEDEANRQKGIAGHLERLCKKTLRDEALPEDLIGALCRVARCRNKEELLEIFAVEQLELIRILSLVSLLKAELGAYREGHPVDSFAKKKTLTALEALKNNLDAFPDFSCSVSLMVAAEEDWEGWPVHLQVSVGLPFNEGIAIKKDVPWFPKGSLRGHKTEGIRRFFKWPVDLVEAEDSEAGEEDKVKPTDLWCGAAEDAAGTFKVTQWAHGLNPKKKPPPKVPQWYGEPAERQSFQILSVDLGNRFCAAFARMEVHRDKGALRPGRLISPEVESASCNQKWKSPVFARSADRGVLRLQGEDAFVERHLGRGRFPDEHKFETERFKALADAILPLERLPVRAVEKMTVPEMGDHLVWRLRRRISRIRSLYKFRWWVHPGSKKRNPNTGHYEDAFSSEEREANKRTVLEMLAKSYTRPPRDDEDKEDAVYEQLRRTLLTEEEWKLQFAGVVPDDEPQTKGKKKRGKRTKDALREICQSLKIPSRKWDDFLDKVSDALKESLCAGWLSNAVQRVQPLSRERPNHEWEQRLELLATDGSAATKASLPLCVTGLLLCEVIEWCLPVKKRHWHWKRDKDRPGLFMGKHGEKDADCEDPKYNPHIRGMRGLSLRRLELVLNLRQLCQSFARMERRWLQPDGGINDMVIKRGEDLHDPCPDLLEKSNELREQRVFQTAHLILTEALGLELKNPADSPRDGKTKKELKNEIDLHGSYQPKKGRDGKDLPRCSVIVLEDLSRYRTSQERTKSENSRLMQWAHRKVIEKLADMAKPFGITLMLVDPAWSSRFDCRTGVAGIRVKEVSRGFENEMPFAAWKHKLTPTKKKDELAELVVATKTLFDANQSYTGSLLVPVDGGELFLPAKAPAEDKEGVINADENAAVNIGLRALAHPDRLDIFPRLRTEKKAGGIVGVRNKRGYFAALPEGDPGRALRVDWTAPVEAPKVSSEAPASAGDEEAAAESSEYPDYFAVVDGKTDFGVGAADKRHLANTDAHTVLGQFIAYERPLFLKRVQEVCRKRIETINEARLKKTGSDLQADASDNLPDLL